VALTRTRLSFRRSGFEECELHRELLNIGNYVQSWRHRSFRSGAVRRFEMMPTRSENVENRVFTAPWHDDVPLKVATDTVRAVTV